MSEVELKKLRYQLAELASSVDIKDKFVRFIIDYDLSSEDVDSIDEIFEQFKEKINSGENFNNYEFESEFNRKLNFNYQAMKILIKIYYEEEKYFQVCSEYIKSPAGDCVELDSLKSELLNKKKGL